MNDREDVIKETTRVLLGLWMELAESGVHDSPESFCKQYATRLADAGLLASGEVEWGVEIGAENGLERIVVRSHPNTEKEAKRWARLHALTEGSAVVVKRRLSGPWVQVEAVQ